MRTDDQRKSGDSRESGSDDVTAAERLRELQVAYRRLESELLRREEIQRRITEELREREREYQRIFQQAHDAILILDPRDEVVLEANERASEIYGFERQELIGLSLLDISIDPTRGKRKVQQTLEEGSFLSFETQQRRKDGSVIDLEINASVIEYRGEMAILSINRDVTDRNKAEEMRLAKEAAERASRTKSQFLANMSHEIRTPMAGVIGLANLLRQADLPEREAEQIETLHSSAESLLLILDDVLDLSKIEDGKLELEEEPFDLEAEIRRVAELTRGGAEARGLDLHVELDENLPRRVVGDAGRLRQVLLNLLGNAVKFTHEGEVAVVAAPAGASTAGEGEPPGVEITVRDTGIGIEEDQLERIFEPFTQRDASTSRQYGGTGLGLAICRRLAHLMGGEIEVRSTPGTGSEFRFLLPLEPAVPQQDGGAAAEGRPSRRSGVEPPIPRGKRVLLAEDNEINQIVALAQLESLGVEAEAVADGLAALERLEEEHFDLVLMDVQMPRLDGYEATRRIRRREEEGRRRLPVVALTAHALDGDREICRRAGMDDYLAKPVREKELAETLARWLHRKPPSSSGG